MSSRAASTRVEPFVKRPRTLRVAVAMYLGIALLNLGVGAWTLSFVPAVEASMQHSDRAVPTGAFIFAVALLALGTAVFSGLLVYFALRLRAGSTWARPALLTTSLLSLVAILTGGGPGLVIIGLLIVAAVIVTRAPVTAWLRSARGLSAG